MTTNQKREHFIILKIMNFPEHKSPLQKDSLIKVDDRWAQVVTTGDLATIRWLNTGKTSIIPLVRYRCKTVGMPIGYLMRINGGIISDKEFRNIYASQELHSHLAANITVVHAYYERIIPSPHETLIS